MSRARHGQKSDRSVWSIGRCEDEGTNTYLNQDGLDQDGSALLEESAKNRSMTADFILRSSTRPRGWSDVTALRAGPAGDLVQAASSLRDSAARTPSTSRSQ